MASCRMIETAGVRIKRHVFGVFWAAGEVLAFPRSIFSSFTKRY